MSIATAPKPRKPRGPSKLKPRHYDYLRLRQAGKSQKEAAALTNMPIATAQRCEKHPDGAKYLADIADNARIAAQYGVREAVQEVDKAIGFAYEQENPNAIAKLLEHKSKLYGLLIERAEIKTTYVDLRGALEQAKERVLVHLNPIQTEENRGIDVTKTTQPAPDTLPKGNMLDAPSVDPLPTSTPLDASRSMDKPVEPERLQDIGTSTDPIIKA